MFHHAECKYKCLATELQVVYNDKYDEILDNELNNKQQNIYRSFIQEIYI